MKRILVQRSNGQSEIAVMEDGKLVEYYRDSRVSGLAGNIYIGRVVRVLQGMQAAFVDIGLDKNAFLYIDDLLPAHIEKQPKEKPPIHDLVQEGGQVMIQVVKEPAGSKGARVTTHYSLPGRFGVYMPHAGYTAISRKIEGPERDRLRRVAERLLQEDEGFIVRTAAHGAPEEALAADLDELRQRWLQLTALAGEEGPVPRLVYSDLDLLPRLVRDLFREDVSEMVVDSAETSAEVFRYMNAGSALASRVRVYQDAPLFPEYDIPRQLELAFMRKVWLDNGGYLIVDRTEALTVIDVNTGKFTGSVGLDNTAFYTNMAAAKEIARLLRLRDIGGLIIIDFIDLETEEYRKRVLEELEKETRKDRTKTVVVGWTRLGLVEMTRKKVRDSKEALLAEPCQACGGSGWVMEEH